MDIASSNFCNACTVWKSGGIDLRLCCVFSAVQSCIRHAAALLAVCIHSVNTLISGVLVVVGEYLVLQWHLCGKLACLYTCCRLHHRAGMLCSY